MYIPPLYSYFIGINSDTNRAMLLLSWFILRLIVVKHQPRQCVKFHDYQSLVVRLAPATAENSADSKWSATAAREVVRIKLDLIES